MTKRSKVNLIFHNKNKQLMIPKMVIENILFHNGLNYIGTNCITIDKTKMTCSKFGESCCRGRASNGSVGVICSSITLRISNRTFYVLKLLLVFCLEFQIYSLWKGSIMMVYTT